MDKGPRIAEKTVPVSFSFYEEWDTGVCVQVWWWFLRSPAESNCWCWAWDLIFLCNWLIRIVHAIGRIARWLGYGVGEVYWLLPVAVTCWQKLGFSEEALTSLVRKAVEFRTWALGVWLGEQARSDSAQTGPSGVLLRSGEFQYGGPSGLKCEITSPLGSIPSNCVCSARGFRGRWGEWHQVQYVAFFPVNTFLVGDGGLPLKFEKVTSNIFTVWTLQFVSTVPISKSRSDDRCFLLQPLHELRADL